MAGDIGQKWGPYQIFKLLGEGGMGKVFLAQQDSMERSVALKFISDNGANIKDFADRFEREAKICASLSHPHIVKVFDYKRSKTEAAAFLIMEYLAGGNLSELIRAKEQLPLEFVLKLLEQITSALDYAHKKGVIHRDLKPQNILLDESGNAYLSDFGLAKLKGASNLTQPGLQLGTILYMSPEQIQGHAIDHRADIYALGVTLFEMLTGRVPFEGENNVSIIYKHLNENPPSVHLFRKNIPASIDQIIKKALAKNSIERHSSAGELMLAVKAAIKRSNGEIGTISENQIGSGILNTQYPNRSIEVIESPRRDTIVSDYFQQLSHALDEINYQCVFVTGPAGSGKSTLLRHLVEHTKKNVVVLAYTGLAAVNVRGQTINSFFRFGFNFVNRKDIKRISNDDLRKIYEAVEIVIIDEVSMLRADMLDNIDAFMRANGQSSSKPFGGAKIIFFGDVFQLPPIVGEPAEKQYIADHYDSEFFFDADVFRTVQLQIIELPQVFRQNDPAFLEILNAVRENNATRKHLSLINQRVYPTFEPKNTLPYLTLTPFKALAKEINDRKLAQLLTQEHIFVGEIRGDYPRENLPTELNLKLKVGAQILFLRNSQDGTWVNGTIGTIAELGETLIKVEIAGKGTFIVQREVWQAYKFVYDKEEEKIKKEEIGTFTQYPLCLAWAITIHKSQGMTLDRAIIDLGKGAFAHGQSYVALSRCKTLEGIVLRQNLNPSDIIVDNRVTSFVSKIRINTQTNM